MLSIVGTSISRAAAIIPATLLIVFIGLLWLLGLLCDKDRRNYVVTLSQQAMDAVGILVRGSPSARSPTPLADTVPRISVELSAELEHTSPALDA
jgi:hypothetical protein